MAPGRATLAATSPGNPVMRNRVPGEDQTVWLLPCIFVRADRRGLGISHAMVAAAADLARLQGAAAIEGWPLSATTGSLGDAFLGREQVFAQLGFTCVHRPSPGRAIMRLEFPTAEE